MKNKPPKIKNGIFQQEVKRGGANAPNIIIQNKALKLAWLSRMLNSPDTFWATYVQSHLQFPLEDMMRGNLNKKDMKEYTIPGIGEFWEEVMQYYAEMTYIKKPKGSEKIMAQPIWLNTLIKNP